MSYVQLLRDFYRRHPAYDIEAAGFLETATAQSEANGDLREALMAHQRLTRLGLDAEAAFHLLGKGLSSAHEICELTETEFLNRATNGFAGGLGAAQAAYREAQACKGQVAHLWANVHGLVGSSVARGLPSHTVPDALTALFSDQPDYAQLFGDASYCTCDHCKSIFGPAAYFVDLMRIIDRCVTRANDIPAPFRLESRRPDLFQLKLSCEATNELIPTLDVVNDLLAKLVEGQLSTGDALMALAQQPYPMGLPYHDPLRQIRLNLTRVGTSTAGLLDALRRPVHPGKTATATATAVGLTFEDPGPAVAAGMALTVRMADKAETRLVSAWDAATSTATVDQPFSAAPTTGSPFELSPDGATIARETLGLSIEQSRMVSIARTTADALRLVYGLESTAPLDDLKDPDVFRRQAALTREALQDLLLQNLSEAEIAAGLAHDLFINRPLAAGEYVHIVVENEEQRLFGLNEATLDRINRFHRLSQWTGLSPADLDWLLASLALTDIDETALQALAAALGVTSMLPAGTTEAATALWHDLKTLTSGAVPGAGSPFDRVYNRPAVSLGAPPYHPSYAANPLYKDPPTKLIAGGGEAPSEGFGRARVLAALGLDDNGLNALLVGLFGVGAEVSLDVPNLSRLHAAALIGRALRLPPVEVLALARLAGADLSAPLSASTSRALLQLGHALGAAAIAPSAALGVVWPDEVDPATPSYDAVKSTWVLARPVLLTADDFAGTVIPRRLARTVYDALLDHPALARDVTQAYDDILGLSPDKIALVLAPVTTEALAFLSAAPIKLSAAQITAVVAAMNRVYAAQVQTLIDQGAGALGASAEMLAAAVSFFDALDPTRAWLPRLLTPVAERESTAPAAPTVEWPAIIRDLKTLARLLGAARTLGALPMEVANFGANPRPFGLSVPAPVATEGLTAILTYKALIAALRCAPEDLWAVLDLPDDAACATGDKSALLAKLTGWPRAQICELAARIGDGPSTYGLVTGLARLQSAFGQLTMLGADARLLDAVLAVFPRAIDTQGDWDAWNAVARSVADLTAARFSPDAWPAIAEAIAGGVNTVRRDALEPLVVWRLGMIHPDITDARSLYAFLLLDVEAGACATTSRVVEGLAALQLYLQRCRLNLETGVVDLPIPDVWWEWMMSYRVWEANRRLFIYPENYLIPSVRKSKSNLFKSLEDALLQANVDDAAVGRAYREYLAGFETLTTLTYVDSYRCQRPEDVATDSETLYLFARTQAEPYTYYYASKGAEGVWSQWLKIDAAINAQTLTPVYAFDRLMVFWVELKPSLSPQVDIGVDEAKTTNTAIYTASIYYSFADVGGGWTPPQTIAEGQVVYVAPSSPPFVAAAGQTLFDMDSLFWRKVNLIHVPAAKLVDANNPGERLVILYGPFLDDNLDAIPVTTPLNPDPVRGAEDPQRFAFELAMFEAAIQVNQAVESRVRGYVPLRDARTLNIDLNADCLVRAAEFMVLVENLSAGAPPAVAPQLDLTTAVLRVGETRNPLQANYAGDTVAYSGEATAARRLDESAFVSPGIDAAGSGQVRVDLVGNGVIDPVSFQIMTFSRNTNLSYLFPTADPSVRAARIAVVREQLLRLQQRGLPVALDSFEVPAIDGAMSKDAFEKSITEGLIDEDGFVRSDFSSTVSLDFLFPDAKPNPVLLRGEVRRVMLDAMAAPLLLGSVAREAAQTMMVKNQPGWFIFNNGNESFLVEPRSQTAPLIDTSLRVRDVDTTPKVYRSSFVTLLIDAKMSDQVWLDLLGNHVIDADGYVISFSARTKLSYLFPTTKPESLRLARISQVRAILLGLPSITALSYYFEQAAPPIVDTSFISELITAPESRDAFAALTAHGVVLEGVVASDYGPDTDFSWLFPKSPADLRSEQIAQVRVVLDREYASVWQASIQDLSFDFTRLTTAAAPRLMSVFRSGGLDRLLALPSQQAPVLPVQPFSQYRPEPGRVIGPLLPDGGQVDFDGPYGLYFWELFLFAPQLVATALGTGGRFEEALRWRRRTFDPTQRPPPPLGPLSFTTRDIGDGDSTAAYDQLRAKGIVTAEGGVSADFGPNTDLSFLFDDIIDPILRELMIGEVQAILLNARLSTPASRFWQFAPFRTHTLETLVQILTDKAQITVYNNSPFDPYAVARLRIGAFEKAAFQQYVETLLAWGDAQFAQATRESLTSAMLSYMEAADLLGEKPQAVGPCPIQGPVSFAEIRARYPAEIPQFLIRMENLLPRQVGRAAPDVGVGAINDIYAVFGVPENAQLLALWDRLEDRLYKLRNCLGLDGRPLHLALFEPPIDPLALARAAARGGSTAVAAADASGQSVPLYRFDQLMLQARSLAMNVTMLGNAMFGALQQRDFERLQRLRATHEVVLLKMTTESRRQDITQLENSLVGLKTSREATTRREEYYTGLADEFMSPAEVIALLASGIAVRFKVLAAALQTSSSIAYTIPQLGSPFAITFGGIQVGNSLAKAANNVDTLAMYTDFVGQTASTIGGYLRRQQDWRFDAEQAERDGKMYDAQIAEATARLAGARQDLAINLQDIVQSQAEADFLLSKFDSVELYGWTSARLSTLYYQTYQLALTCALAAQNAYRFQLGQDADFINLQYWDPSHNGLLAGETLTLSLDQLEQSFFRNNVRRLEIIKAVSLIETAPAELLRLRLDGECVIALPEALFDFDFPGHYNRRLVTIDISLVFADESRPEAHITLTQTRSAILKTTDAAGLAWMLNPEDAPPPSVVFNLVGGQAVAITNAGYDGTGMFETLLNYDPRYFPFEGSGAVSDWLLQMPKACNQFDFEQIADVVATLRYTALDGGEVFRNSVVSALSGAAWTGGAYVDAAATDAWTTFMSDHEDPDSQTLSLPAPRSLFPPNLTQVQVSTLGLMLVVEGVTLPATSQFLSVAPPNGPQTALPLAGAWGSLTLTSAASPSDAPWTFVVDLAAIRGDPALKGLLGEDGFLNPGVFRTMDLVFGFNGQAFAPTPAGKTRPTAPRLPHPNS